MRLTAKLLVFECRDGSVINGLHLFPGAGAGTHFSLMTFMILAIALFPSGMLRLCRARFERSLLRGDRVTHG